MKKIFLIIASFALTLPVHAADLINPLGGDQTNPKGITNPNIIIGKVINGVLGIIGTVALLLFIYGGLKILLSLGEDGKIKEGRNIMIWAAVGLAIIFGSYSLSRFALNIVTLQ